MTANPKNIFGIAALHAFYDIDGPKDYHSFRQNTRKVIHVEQEQPRSKRQKRRDRGKQKNS